MVEKIEKTKQVDELSYIESQATKLIADSMKKDPQKTIALMYKILTKIDKIPSTNTTNVIKKTLTQKLTSIEKNIDDKKYLNTIINTVSLFTDRRKKIPYGTGPGQLVCDQFVKKVLTKVEPEKEKKDTINSIYGTVNMFNKIAPKKTLTFSGNTLVGTQPPIGSLIFFIRGKQCGHVGFYMGMNAGRPEIADASNGGVSKRYFGPTEASKFYYEENYREKFLKKA
ncbi:MAG: hypothetical protein NT085_01015 [candidate division SR1 bacterium]|nr:hypothetical protein [candidate division SR1 bacterium]